MLSVVFLVTKNRPWLYLLFLKSKCFRVCNVLIVTFLDSNDECTVEGIEGSAFESEEGSELLDEEREDLEKMVLGNIEQNQDDFLSEEQVFF